MQGQRRRCAVFPLLEVAMSKTLRTGPHVLVIHARQPLPRRLSERQRSGRWSAHAAVVLSLGFALACGDPPSAPSAALLEAGTPLSAAGGAEKFWVAFFDGVQNCDVRVDGRL